jgi:hypothetical protein
MRFVFRLATVFVIPGIALLIGLPSCTGGGAAHNVAPVKGRVTHNGQPVTGGSLTFQPTKVVGAAPGETGRPGTAEIKNDGTFVVSTYGTDDGAVIGTHRLMYMPPSTATPSVESPSGDSPEHDQGATAKSPYAGLVPQEPEVEVKAGGNEINIELIPGPKPAEEGAATADSGAPGSS